MTTDYTDEANAYVYTKMNAFNAAVKTELDKIRRDRAITDADWYNYLFRLKAPDEALVPVRNLTVGFVINKGIYNWADDILPATKLPDAAGTGYDWEPFFVAYERSREDPHTNWVQPTKSPYSLPVYLTIDVLPDE